ncbi:hypothetical protein, partial [Mycobacterium sp. 1245801.1]|uniref:DUF7213 family protein n=1 Tax=Mycobacterium sp. 1245801.1 TaxID=1834075 RepID=UPI000A5C782E
LIREALQSRINDGDVREGYLVTHYVAIVGLVGVTDNGNTETGVVVMEQNGQAGYITHGLLCEAPEILARAAESREADCDETD